MKTFGIIMLILMLGIGGCAITVFNKGCNAVTGVIDKTIKPDNIIYNYEWFKQEYQDYTAINKKIDEANIAVERFKSDSGDRSKWTFEDKNEYSRLTSILDGLNYQKSDIISTYNARSQMVNRDIFKDHDLPDHLNQ